jgi:hypothetical protein
MSAENPFMGHVGDIMRPGSTSKYMGITLVGAIFVICLLLTSIWFMAGANGHIIPSTASYWGGGFYIGFTVIVLGIFILMIYLAARAP